MALTKEDLNAISGLLEPLSAKLTALQDHVENETDRNIEVLSGKVTTLQDHVENETDRNVESLSEKITALQLHIENETDKSICILAENHGMLVDKLNQAIPAHKKELILDVEISSLKTRVSNLEEKVKKITA